MNDKFLLVILSCIDESSYELVCRSQILHLHSTSEHGGTHRILLNLLGDSNKSLKTIT